ncbi:MAG: M56 family metallopeptidase, partial [Oscillospiraceae bacterium]|nr:M56 family metallopeptidase [Oscillospiraceae bacterium]
GGAEKPLVSFDTYVYSSAPGSAAPEDAAPAPAADRTDAAAQTASVERRTHSVYIPTAMKVWLIGICAMALYALISILILRLKVRPAVDAGNRVRVSDGAASPFILGLVRPRIYMPSGFGEKQAAAALAHERAHLSRLDHVWKLLSFVLLAVHWFNPLVWLAFVLFGRDLELICDEHVIRGMDAVERADYSQALLDCSFKRAPGAVYPLAFAEAGVKTRIKSVLNYKKPAFWIVAAVIFVCVAVGVCFLTSPASYAKAPDLSLLNYKNAISTIADQSEIRAKYYTTDMFGSSYIRTGSINSLELAEYLEGVTWGDYSEPSGNTNSDIFIELLINDDYSLRVFKNHLANVSVGSDTRWYNCAWGDYSKLLDIFLEEPYAVSVLPPLSEKRVYIKEDTLVISRNGDDFGISGDSFGELTFGTSFEDASARGFGSVFNSSLIINTNYSYWYAGAPCQVTCQFDDKNGLYVISLTFTEWFKEDIGDAATWFELYRKFTELFGEPQAAYGTDRFSTPEELNALLSTGSEMRALMHETGAMSPRVIWGTDEKFLALEFRPSLNKNDSFRQTTVFMAAWGYANSD